MQKYLSQFQRKNFYPHTTYVDPNCLTFPNGVTKTNYGWASDSKGRDCFINFWKNPKSSDCQTWVGIASSWRRSWVKNNWDKAWDPEPWHAWAFALVKNEAIHKSRTLVIYDCDADMEKARANKSCCGLNGVQAQFVKVAREQYGRKMSIWYGGNNAQRGQNKCLRFSFEWPQEVSSHPDIPFRGPSDYRVKHCVMIDPIRY